jgi:hypothetical protein
VRQPPPAHPLIRKIHAYSGSPAKARANIAAAGLVSLETAGRMTLSTVRMVQGFSRWPLGLASMAAPR